MRMCMTFRYFYVGEAVVTFCYYERGLIVNTDSI